ncbi:hypothetical protein JW926_15950 [Candidatus Sumerlaeota bacterium]|nr:hypothetical protein [Candidatus Sumerlaeota bacterium]
MTSKEKTAEGFVSVLKALPKAQRNAIIVHIARDKEFAHDILDLATIETRRKESSRPFHHYLEFER